MVRNGRFVTLQPLNTRQNVFIIIVCLLLLILTFFSVSCIKKPEYRPLLPRCEEWICRGDFTYNTVGKDCNCLED